MQEKIKKYLSQIEAEKNIKILFACETGSRAWGFPSPDSDFDIRIVYVHQKKWYLRLDEQKDSLEAMFENNDLDITGWELRKSLRLLHKSNAAFLERIQSPIIYQEKAGFKANINELAQAYYSRIATIHHYRSMAKKCLSEIVGQPTFKLKKFFYALRAATACQWILTKEEKPPIEFQRMRNGLPISDQLNRRIDELIALKATISEAYLHEGENELIDWMTKMIDRADHEGPNLPNAKGKIEPLNAFFQAHLSD